MLKDKLDVIPDIYKPSDINIVIDEYLKDEKIIKTNKKIGYYNVPCAFDIETYSFTENGEKRAIMYVWMLGINGAVIVGRTWSEFLECISAIENALELSKYKRLIIYVHNLAYEFHWFCKWFDWENVFATDTREPVKAITTGFIEFRCSYILSNYSLDNLGKNLTYFNVKKMTGDLDYNVARHSKTPLTDKEIGYCINDVVVVMAYISECIINDGNIALIPLTNTGYVRNYCRKSVKGKHGDGKYERYRALMSNLTLTPEEYTLLRRAFQGGFTHCNAWYSGVTLNNVSSIDFTSSYPTVMIAEEFPMSKGVLYTVKDKDDFYKQCACYCCVFDLEMFNIQMRDDVPENILSLSHCFDVVNADTNNGRIVSAKYAKTTCTEIDFYWLQKFYTFDFEVKELYRYSRGYLPKDFILSVLGLYQKKTTLKNVDGQEVNYIRSKNMLNSCYGMCVTDICRAENIYTDEWRCDTPNIDKCIDRYNKSANRFLSYAWGIYVTAYARQNLYTGILEFGNDYVYSDTDSIKCRNFDKHKNYVDKYNNDIISKLYDACTHHNIDTNLITPITNDGVKKPLGVWDFEGTYDRFKSLGAKRYLTQKGDKFELTVAGVNKKTALNYMVNKFGADKIFDSFNNSLYIPPEQSGKLTHTYFDNEISGQITDYNGVACDYHELSYIHLSQCDFTLSIAQTYLNYLLELRCFV